MTRDKQIRQNAEAYSNGIDGSMCYPKINNTAYDAFIAGAHSRDEEIKELKKQLAAMTSLKNSFAGGVDILDNDNKKLQEELDKLHNPWISVKERLPERENDKASWSNYVFIRTCFNSHEEAKYDTINHIWYDKHKKVLDDNKYVTHWMSIPELKKGDIK